MCVGCNNSQSSDLECSNCGLTITDNAKFCSNCGESITNKHEENNNDSKQCSHTWQEATCIALKTCTICQATEGTYGEHNWQDATCTTPKTCSVCNITKGDAVHKWNNATCTTPKTCSVCSITEGDIVHKWTNATCSVPKTCSVCKKTEGSALGHTGGEKCSRCGQVDKKVIIENAKNAVFIYGIDLNVNSAGGVNTYITWKNTSQKEIKYIVFSVQYYNRVKDVLKDDIDDSTTKRLQQTGPIPYGKGCYDVFVRDLDTATCSYFVVDRDTYDVDAENGWEGTYWKAPFYNSSTTYIKLTKIEIEYMDGTYYTISDPEAIAAVVGTGEHIYRVLANDTSDDYLR